jgi:hypothetical protein
MMGSLRLHLELALWRHGAWAPLAAAMVLGAAMLLTWRPAPPPASAPTVVQPTRAADDAANGRDSDSVAWGAVQATWLPYRDTAATIRRLVALTRPALAWQHAEFQQTTDDGLGWVRLQIDVPVTGDYRRMRRALDSALRELPALSLDQVSFVRPTADQTQVEARLRFSLWLKGAEGRR